MQEITYIKDSKEKTMSRLEYALSRNKEPYKKEMGSCDEVIYNIPEETELLHLKNFHFNEVTLLNCLNENTILILDNCTFRRKMEITGGCVSISKPKYGNSSNNIRFYDNKEVELEFEDEQEETTNSNTIIRYKYDLYNVENLVITGNNFSTDIIQKEGTISSVVIKNANLSMFTCDTRMIKEMKIINSKVNWDHTYCIMGRKTSGTVKIENSSIKAEYGLDLLGGNPQQVQIEDSTLEAIAISLPNGMTSNNCRENDTLEFSSTDENASGNLLSARLSLLSFLKTVKKEKQQSNNEKLEAAKKIVNEIYEPSIEMHNQKISQYRQLIEQEEAAISGIKEELDSVIESINTHIENQKVKLLQKTIRK